MNLSEYQKLYANILYGKGMTQKQIAEILGVCDSTISNLSQKDEDWGKFRLPKIDLPEIIDMLKGAMIRNLIDMAVGREKDGSRTIQNCMRLATTISSLVDLHDHVSPKNEALTCQNLMKWLIEKGKSSSITLDDIQEYHDIKNAESS